MRFKFRLEPDNTITVLQEDQDTNISIENDGDNKILTIDMEEPESIIDVRIPPGAED
jgi:hypothetical protein